MANPLYLALDLPRLADAAALVKRVRAHLGGVKLGLEFFCAHGHHGVHEIAQVSGLPIFLDLKLHDIPNTVAGAMRAISVLDPAIVTVHAAGGQAMLEAAKAAAPPATTVVAVTVLTSLDRGDLDDLGFACDVEKLVLSRARRALEAGCDGVVSSGLEAPKLREFIDQRLLVVTPGIRPVENKPVDDQKRTVDVAQAFANGADYIVVGRPIRAAADPRAAAEAIQQTIAGIFGTGAAQ